MDQELLIDMALMKRHVAELYALRRRALRSALSLGLPSEIIRMVRHQVRNHKSTWSVLRRELRASA